jgi:hypothetical protein
MYLKPSFSKVNLILGNCIMLGSLSYGGETVLVARASQNFNGPMIGYY